MTAERPRWVLAFEQAASPCGLNYYCSWTAIGPCGTWDVDEAYRFASEKEALLSPAYSFPMTFYKPMEVGGAA